jgi:hypothetical protein
MPEMIPDRIKAEFLDQMKYIEDFGCACLFFQVWYVELLRCRFQITTGSPSSPVKSNSLGNRVLGLNLPELQIGAKFWRDGWLLCFRRTR